MKLSKSRLIFKNKTPEVKPGLYWFINDTGKKYIVKVITGALKAIMVDTVIYTIGYVDSIGYGEYIPFTDNEKENLLHICQGDPHIRNQLV